MFWLFKTELFIFSIDDLKQNKITQWDGVRNYQARNFIREGMKKMSMLFCIILTVKNSGL
nr:EVE domain-containing protein [Candidatus Coxiella mudrowiae]